MDLVGDLQALSPMPRDRGRALFGRAWPRVLRGILLPDARADSLWPFEGDVTLHDDGSWSPGGLEPAVVVPIWDGWPPAMLDLAAIDLRSDKTYLRLGFADALGQAQVNSLDTGVRIRWHDSPTKWLRSGGAGVCPLGRAFAAEMVTRGDLTLVADSVAAGEALQRRLRACLPSLPRVGVARQ